MQKETYLRINECGVLYISAACGACLPTEVDIYESDGHMILVGNLVDGRYHLSSKRKNCSGKYLVAKQVVAYVMEKLGVGVGERIPAWVSERADDTIVGFGVVGRAHELDSTYRKVDLSYQKLIAGRLRVEGKQILLPFGTLPAARYSAYEAEDAVALFEDSDGSCVPVARQRQKYEAISADALVALVVDKFGVKATLMFTKTQRGIVISDSRIQLYDALKKDKFQQIHLPAMPEAYLSLSTRRVIYFSVGAWRALGYRFSVYVCGRLVALKPDIHGDLRMHCGHRYSCSSETLRPMLAGNYPEAKQLFLTPYAGMYLLTVDGFLQTNLPRVEAFQQCAMDKFGSQSLWQCTSKGRSQLK